MVFTQSTRSVFFCARVGLKKRVRENHNGYKTDTIISNGCNHPRSNEKFLNSIPYTRNIDTKKI